MTAGETFAFVRDATVFECTLMFRVSELVGVDPAELHWEAFWRVRVDGVLFGALLVERFLERDSAVENRVVAWYRRERARRATPHW